MIPSVSVDSSVIKEIIDQFKLDHRTSEHGIRHWLRVCRNGLDIAERNQNVDASVVFWFSFFHDSRRENDYEDPKHGLRASKFVDYFVDKLGLDEQQTSKLKIACAGHTHKLSHPDETISACWDADRLDLGRVNKVTDAKYLTLDESKDPDFMRGCMIKAGDWMVEHELVKWLCLESEL